MAAVASMASMATMTTVMTTVMATVVATFLRDSFGLQWLQFELRNLALAAAWPHARPLTVAFLWWFFAALTTWIVDTSTKGDWERH